MARGRWVDSNVYSSGLRGCCGRGCSTRGRGGTIPPLPPLPSSSTIGPSSFVQPPMPPPLSLIPSSSTPFVGLAESSPASQPVLHQVEKYSCEPTTMEVFTYSHTKDHDGHTFIDRHAVVVNENYSTARERVVFSQVGSEAKLNVDELALYLAA
ncbi:hypothetical protein JCGZ_27071 [Jatropha curcas]|uniref:Uncharacterized protein n=1 Tax=Jatropha curcas TaxID=180498 RepID=A0A067JVK9_JATCU|nr:hypothetical protein JCGZ_27071 [Jatropha curcas]